MKNTTKEPIDYDALQDAGIQNTSIESDYPKTINDQTPARGAKIIVYAFVIILACFGAFFLVMYTALTY